MGKYSHLRIRVWKLFREDGRRIFTSKFVNEICVGSNRIYFRWNLLITNFPFIFQIINQILIALVGRTYHFSSTDRIVIKFFFMLVILYY